MDALFAKLDQMDAKLDRLISGPELPIVGVKEAMRLTGSGTPRTLHRTLIKLGVQPYARGKYRRMDITNAIGRRILTKNKSST